jgi:hypothetical protein
MFHFYPFGVSCAPRPKPEHRRAGTTDNHGAALALELADPQGLSGLGLFAEGVFGGRLIVRRLAIANDVASEVSGGHRSTAWVSAPKSPLFSMGALATVGKPKPLFLLGLNPSHEIQ